MLRRNLQARNCEACLDLNWLAKREILQIQEYLTSLTSDIVPGKLDVRETASTLPTLYADTTEDPVADEMIEEIETEVIQHEHLPKRSRMAS